MARKFFKPEGQWNSTADVTVANFEESGHPVFRASSALDLGFLEKVGDVRFTSVRILRMQTFCFARSFLQTSSASTEQSRIGVIPGQSF